MGSNSTHTNLFHSTLSFRPLIKAWEDIVQNGREGSKHLYRSLLEKVQQYPELLQPITDESIVQKHHVLIEEMMATLFPVTYSDEQDMYAVSIPFVHKPFYASRKFQQMFMDLESNNIVIPEESEKSMVDEKIACAYQMILARLYNRRLTGQVTSVYPYKCPDTNLDKFMELSLDTRFIDVSADCSCEDGDECCRTTGQAGMADLPELPAECASDCSNVRDILNFPELQEKLPLHLFRFEGIIIIHIRDVTEREVLNKIRDRLLDIHTFSDTQVFHELQLQVQNLLGVPGIQTGIKPFFKVNNHLVLTEVHTTTEFSTDKMPDADTLQAMYQQVSKSFKASPEILVIDNITEEIIEKYPFLAFMYKNGVRNAIVCPLFTHNNEDLLGLLLIVSQTPGTLTHDHIYKIEPAIPLFKLALEKSQEQLDHQVDRVIKDQFTAVQDAVEWRFTEAALHYLTLKNKGQQAKIEPIVFEGVYPLYGAIDIRNSSIERNNAIQLDLLEQLNLASDILQKARQEHPFPLLDETIYKIQKYAHSVANIMFADEEIAILHFLQKELVDLFRHLQSILPSMEATINKYFEAINSPVQMVYRHRREYEESIVAINNEVARFIDEEQKAAQHIFPHYFERFVTDGVDFNIYIGQSISPAKKFDFFYLKNLKIWQLTTLAKAARLTKRLQKDLALPLQTTQLILAHSHPISISFRTAERKFDVDGAYNIRYEIIKKRIDKVHVKNSNERFTKPGMLAIVYSQPQEAKEYLEYIEFLQNRQLLKGEVEKFDLEELQGVSGLKGLRVAINYEEEVPETEDKKASASITR